MALAKCLDGGIVWDFLNFFRNFHAGIWKISNLPSQHDLLWHCILYLVKGGRTLILTQVFYRFSSFIFQAVMDKLFDPVKKVIEEAMVSYIHVIYNGHLCLISLSCAEFCCHADVTFKSHGHVLWHAAIIWNWIKWFVHGASEKNTYKYCQSSV